MLYLDCQNNKYLLGMVVCMETTMDGETSCFNFSNDAKYLHSFCKSSMLTKINSRRKKLINK